MKFGILTFHFPLNYGAMLQAFSLKSTIANMGHECVMIDYVPTVMNGTCIINPFKTNLPLTIKLKSLVKLPYRYLSAAKFSSFSNTYLDIDSKTKNKNRHIFSIPDGITHLVVGSDQVWNGNITQNDPSYFFRPYIDQYKCYSYAASIGGDTPTDEVKAYFKELLPKFKSVAVRESNLKEYLDTEIQHNSIHVVDPVFLLTRENWMSIAQRPSKVPEKFILYYSLEANETLADQCLTLSGLTGLPIISIHPFARSFIKKSTTLYATGPCEFLWLIANADFVCTNSFHAVSFASIFKKKLVHLSHSSLGARVKSLLNLFDVKNGAVTDTSTNNSIDYIDFEQSNNNKILQMIDHSKEFIAKMCK